MIKRSILLLLLCLTKPFGTMAQESSSAPEVLMGYVEESLYIEGQTVRIRGKVTFDTEASLTLGPGVVLLFEPNASLQITNALKIKGTKERPVVLRSLNKNRLGKGIEILKKNEVATIEITGAIFHDLTYPVLFRENWYRPSVLISQCQFSHNEGQIFSILRSDELSDVPVIRIEGNAFTNNHGNMVVDAYRCVFNVEFKNNVIKDNTIKGYSKTDYWRTALLFMNFNKLDELVIENNSFVDNKIVFPELDTVVAISHMNIIGGKKVYDMTENYVSEYNVRVIP